MKRFSYTGVSFAIAAVAIVAVGMLPDPDVANADELGEQPVAHDRMPGYQVIPTIPKYKPLTQDELAKLNAPVEGSSPTF